MACTGFLPFCAMIGTSNVRKRTERNKTKQNDDKTTLPYFHPGIAHSCGNLAINFVAVSEGFIQVTNFVTDVLIIIFYMPKVIIKRWSTWQERVKAKSCVSYDHQKKHHQFAFWIDHVVRDNNIDSCYIPMTPSFHWLTAA